MIGFNALGKLGRLGNQMFQFASLKGIARNRGYNFCFPPSNNQHEYQDHQLLIPFKLISTNELNVQYIDNERPSVVENGFGFDKNLYDTCPDWVSLQGFFQTEKYFKNIKSEIKKDFEFKDDIRIPCEEMVSTLDSPIALHIRRTDYITNPNHTCLGLDYYERALKEFDDQPVLIFSDDPKWCQEQKLFEDDRFMISQDNDQYIDMCLMTMCDGHIIANSSFSWWGAWLSNSSKVIAPKGWFEGSNNSHLDTKDIYCTDWIVL
tara:strand:- start:5012 stop:5800 length:789 start_codon:yes stop_codon:yes gene_type:complete